MEGREWSQGVGRGWTHDKRSCPSLCGKAYEEFDHQSLAAQAHLGGWGEKKGRGSGRSRASNGKPRNHITSVPQTSERKNLFRGTKDFGVDKKQEPEP